MNRRSPVRSVLAERRMFANGGMLPISTPIKNAPSGILASSLPLIDSVSQEILAPLTGGPMPMAEGGVAKFKHGGVHGIPTREEWNKFLNQPPPGVTVSEQVIEKVPALPVGQITYQDTVNFNKSLQKAMGLKNEALQAVQPSGVQEFGRGVSEFGRDIVENVETLFRTGPEVSAAQAERDADRAEAKAERLGEVGFDSEKEQQAEILRINSLPTSFWLGESGADGRTIDYWNKTDLPSIYQTSVAPQDVTIAEGPDRTDISNAVTTPRPGEGPYAWPTDEQRRTEEPAAKVTDTDRPPDDTQLFLEQGLMTDFKGKEPAAEPKVTPRADEKIPTSSVFLTEWLSNNPDKSSEEVPADAVNNSVDSIFTDALNALEGKEFDVNAFKSEIEALIPKAEKDPEMEGLLIAMMGASIMAGTDENAWVNVGAGIEKGMPAIINFKNKQKEDQRARDMTVAKLAIETKLSREQDTRTAIRGIEAEQRGVSVGQFEADESARRAVEKEQRQTANYMVVRKTTLPGTAFDSNAPEDSVVNIPFDTKMNLTASDAARLKGLGIPLFEVGKPTISYEDIRKSTVPTTFGSTLKPEAWNKMVTGEKVKFFAFGTDKGLELDYFRPEGFGIKNKITNSFMTENEWASLYFSYDRYRSKFENVGNKLVKLNEIAKSGELTGVEGLKGRIGDTLRGLGSVLGNEIADSLLGGEHNFVSAGGQFDVQARLVLAEIAPWILGESGKTISDADRVRVARALGYEAKLEDGVMMIEGFNSQLLKNPNQVQMALNEVAGVVNKYIDMGDSQMAQAMVRFGRLSPDQSKTLLDSLGKSGYEEKVKKRKASTPQGSLGEEGVLQSTYGVQWDLDLTAGGT